MKISSENVDHLQYLLLQPSLLPEGLPFTGGFIHGLSHGGTYPQAWQAGRALGEQRAFNAQGLRENDTNILKPT